MRHVVIIAGGSGTRLWPMSQADRPKQLLPLVSGRSLLELAVRRAEALVPRERVRICAGEWMRPAVESADLIAAGQFVSEPVGRDTCAAIALSAEVLARQDPDAVFGVLTADHLIDPLDRFARIFELGFSLVEVDAQRAVVFAITPTHPATGYGYIEQGAEIDGFAPACRVQSFTEKPDEETARGFIESGRFRWNSGMFVFSARGFLDALERHQPDIARGMKRIVAAWGTPQQGEVLAAVYAELPRVSVDVGILEPLSREPEHHVCAVPMAVYWLDVGNWFALGQTLPADEHGNRSNTRLRTLDSRGVLAIADDPTHTIAVIGCQDLIIVRTADTTLVVPASQAERVRIIAGTPERPPLG
jgi:mannose-1-phosphate guanylyltransferase